MVSKNFFFWLRKRLLFFIQSCVTFLLSVAAIWKWTTWRHQKEPIWICREQPNFLFFFYKSWCSWYCREFWNFDVKSSSKKSWVFANNNLSNLVCFSSMSHFLGNRHSPLKLTKISEKIVLFCGIYTFSFSFVFNCTYDFIPNIKKKLTTYCFFRMHNNTTT